MPPLAVALAMLAIACRNDSAIGEVEKPPAPNMQTLLDAYAAPTASLSMATLPELSAGLAARVATVDSIQLDRRVLDAAAAGLAQILQQNTAAPQALAREELSVVEQPLTVRGQGYLEVTRICDGWSSVPVPDFANGFMQLTLGFTEQGLDQVIWGTLSACRYRLGEHTVQLDGVAPDPLAGDVRVFIGQNATLMDFRAFPDPVLVELAAQVLVDGSEVTGQLSFRIDLNTRGLELLVPLTGGHVLAAVAANRASVVRVRAVNGSFDCDLATQRCTAPDGSSFGVP
jgi:hypothetical protein